MNIHCFYRRIFTPDFEMPFHYNKKRASKTVPIIVRILASFLNLFSYPIIVLRHWYVDSRKVWLKTFGFFYRRRLKTSYISTAPTETNHAGQVATIANEFAI